MTHILPNLRFEGDCERAVELYKRAFGAEAKALIRYADANPLDFIADDEGVKDKIFHCEIVIGGDRLMLCDSAGGEYRRGNAVSLLIHFDSEGEIMDAYNAISEGAEIISPMASQTYCSRFASLIDRYGVRWELMEG